MVRDLICVGSNFDDYGSIVMNFKKYESFWQLLTAVLTAGGMLLGIAKFWIDTEFVSKASAANFAEKDDFIRRMESFDRKLDRIDSRIDLIQDTLTKRR